jgi:hypothetical protein
MKMVFKESEWGGLAGINWLRAGKLVDCYEQGDTTSSCIKCGEFLD